MYRLCIDEKLTMQSRTAVIPASSLTGDPNACLYDACCVKDHICRGLGWKTCSLQIVCISLGLRWKTCSLQITMEVQFLFDWD
ncbi:hypothetical protein SADUNF_Sadunf16G0143300 [Salix dunnii]|uniref:Uncharacterized protein n=1 Tax=Salix dunnii TaxID=1413687 RepID=A0A835MQ98_9ROSI|nr:hypothetical protein SADUNF_Sadunf16G0143300 [Salix dunnii]